MKLISRITTRYNAREDRLRLTGERDGGEVVCLWLTKRLLDRLLPHLFRWLEAQSPATATTVSKAVAGQVVQEFAQQAAVAGLRPLPPVAQVPQTVELLVASIDIARQNGGVLLTFKAEGVDGDPPALRLTAAQLRQWLSIAHQQYKNAVWEFGLWPEWVVAAQRVERPPVKGMMH